MDDRSWAITHRSDCQIRLFGCNANFDLRRCYKFHNGCTADARRRMGSTEALQIGESESQAISDLRLVHGPSADGECPLRERSSSMAVSRE